MLSLEEELKEEQGDASDDLLKDTSPVRAGDQPRCVFGPGWIQRDQMCASGESDDASESESHFKGGDWVRAWGNVVRAIALFWG